jgi:hypothetical protein
VGQRLNTRQHLGRQCRSKGHRGGSGKAQVHGNNITCKEETYSMKRYAADWQMRPKVVMLCSIYSSTYAAAWVWNIDGTLHSLLQSNA